MTLFDHLSVPQAFVTKNLFEGGAFIPAFQRSAAWDHRQMRLFFDAIRDFFGQEGNVEINSNTNIGNKLFLGGISLRREHGGGSLGIIDGQQRMNAIFAFCTAARDVLFEQGDFESAVEIQDKIVGRNELLFKSSPELIQLFKQLHRPLVRLSLNSTDARDLGERKTWEVELENGNWLVKGDKVLNQAVSGKIESIDNNKITVIFEEPTDVENIVEYLGPTKYSLTDHPIHWGYRYFGTRLALIFGDVELAVTNTQAVAIRAGKNGSLHFDMSDDRNQYKWFFFEELERVFEYNGADFSTTFRGGFQFIVGDGNSLQIKVHNNINQTVSIAKEHVLFKLKKDESFFHHLLNQGSYINQLKEFSLGGLLFSVVFFSTEQGALEHFIASNDASRLSRLYNYDLLNAYVFELKAGLRSQNRGELANSVEGYWVEITASAKAPFANIEQPDRGVSEFDEFLASFMLCKNWRPEESMGEGNGKRYKKKDNGNQMFGRIKRELGSISEHDDQILKFFGDMAFAAKIYHALHKCPSDPAAHAALRSINASKSVRAMLQIFAKASKQIFHPAIMTVLLNANQRPQGLQKTSLNSVLETFLWGLIYAWAIPAQLNKTRAEDKYSRLTANDFYSWYEGENSIYSALRDWDGTTGTTSNLIQDLNGRFKRATNTPNAEYTKERCSAFVLKPDEYPLFVFAYEYLITPKMHLGNIYSEELSTNESSHCEVEHVMPKNIREDTWPLAIANEERHRILSNALGNLILLEAKINRSIKDAAWEEKKHAYKEDSVLKSPRQIQNKNDWTFDEIETRSGESWEKIIEKLDVFL